MAYSKQTWADGDVITASKLNHMEDGIESAAESGGSSSSNEMVVQVVKTYVNNQLSYQLNKSYGEIYNAFRAGTHVYVVYEVFTGATEMANPNQSYALSRGEVVSIYNYLWNYRIAIEYSGPIEISGVNSIMSPGIVTFGFTSNGNTSLISAAVPEFIRMVHTDPNSVYTGLAYPFDH